MRQKVRAKNVRTSRQDLQEGDDEEAEGVRRREEATRRLVGHSVVAEEIRRRLGEEEADEAGRRVSKVSALFKKFWAQGDDDSFLADEQWRCSTCWLLV